MTLVTIPPKTSKLPTPPSSRKNTSTPADESNSGYVSDKFKKRTGSIVEWLNKTTAKLGGKYVLVVVSPENGTDIYFNSPMANFVDNFLLEKDIVEYLSNGGDGEIDQDGVKNIPSRGRPPRPASPLPSKPISPTFMTSKPNTSLKSKIKLDLCNHDDIIKFLHRGFVIIQQAICKTLAKSWVREIEPKKQTNYPYKLGDMAKPDWWPEEVRHKEPDHLTKEERVTLLVALITHEDISTNRLRDSVLQSVREIDPDKLALLEELYFVAESEKMFLNGNSEGEQIVEVTDLSLWARQSKIVIYHRKDDRTGSKDKSSDDPEFIPANRTVKERTKQMIHSKDKNEHKESCPNVVSTSGQSSDSSLNDDKNGSYSMRLGAHQQLANATNGYATSSPTNGIYHSYSSSSRFSSSASSLASSFLSSSSNPTNSPLSSGTPTNSITPLSTSHYLNPFDNWTTATPIGAVGISGGVSNRLLFFDQTIIPTSTPIAIHDTANLGHYMSNRIPHKPVRSIGNHLQETPSRVSGQRMDDIGAAGVTGIQSIGSTPFKPSSFQLPLPLTVQSNEINVDGKRSASSDRFTYIDEQNGNEDNRSKKRFNSGDERGFFQDDAVTLKFEN